MIDIPVATINERSPYLVTSYLISELLSSSHPDHDSIIEQFNAFIANLPQKLDELQN